jgi:hypothetical protein
MANIKARGTANFRNAFPKPAAKKRTMKTMLAEMKREARAGVHNEAQLEAHEAARTRREYDAAQTALCNRLRAHLQSLAVLAVQAQDLDPAGDALADLLGDIARDAEMAVRINGALQADDVYAEIKG